ncbi:EAL domain-containing protein [Arcobacter sp. 15-2]|uniref:EAL domain-containing protein n=1 Tax=Arcobacter sp. 15-2 TaxID=3374109 RepID=UPI00399C6826
MTTKSTTYNKITARIIIIMLTLTLTVAYIYSEYMKEEVIINLAKQDAKKTSRLVFESMYSAMQKGWDKEEIHEIIKRLNKVDDQLEIFVYRSKLVANLYGDIEHDKKVRETDLSIQKSLKGEESLDIINSELIKYYFPVVANDQCKQCHTNAQEGDVLGVININYPITELKIALKDIVKFFLFFIISFTVVVFVLLLLNFNKYLVSPIQNFIETANNIKKSSDITQRVKVDDNINEIQSMQKMFNGMLDSIEYQFYYDSLTKLKNRKSLQIDLEKSDNYLLMIINVDKFQQINNLYGDAIGDKILLEFKEKFLELLPENSTLYKLHADEFGIIAHNNTDLDAFEKVASNIICTLDKYKFSIEENNNIFINLTIGIAFGSDLLLQNADMALKLAKKDKQHYLTYNTDMISLSEYENRLAWTNKLNDAISNDKIIPLFQPIIDCKTHKIIKYEALMRIKTNCNDYIVPFHFLNISKENKLYFKLTLIMLKKTFAICRDTGVKFSLNLNKEDMINKEIVDYIIEQFKTYNFGHNISFEILESEGIEDFQEISEFIKKVKAYGATISIDDFGTGYSNFEYLMNLDFDYLKIDGSMIRNIDKDEKSQIVTKTIVDFAQRIGVKTIAEFVSSKTIYDKVKEMNIDFAQGYYLGEPSSQIEKKRNK